MNSVTICELIEETAARGPDNIALQMYGEEGLESWTYRNFWSAVRKLSAALKDNGLKKGARAAIWAHLEPNWVIACLGILHCGGVVVPLDEEYTSQQVLTILEATGCRFVFAKEAQLPLLREMDPQPKPLLVSLGATRTGADGSLAELLMTPEELKLPTSSPEDPALIFYTSGTTGKPKGVVIPHRSVISTVQGTTQRVGLTPDDRLIALIPGHHVLAWIANILVPLVSGASVVYLRSVKSTEVLQTIRCAQITVFPAVPRIFYLLHQKIMTEVEQKPAMIRMAFRALLNLSFLLRRGAALNLGKRLFAPVHRVFGDQLRLLVSAASHFDPKVIHDLYALGFNILQGYALTETFGGGTITPFDANVMGSVGSPLPQLQLKIIEPDDAGTGEIAISGPSVMLGYYEDPESTARVLKDGWFHTGDLGYSDARGNYYITGRKNEMIVLSSGKKIYPEEVEEHYLQSPFISEICLLRNTRRNAAGADSLQAIIVPDFDGLKRHRRTSAKDVIRAEVERLSGDLPRHKRILRYDIRVEPLPRTTTKKIMRWVLQNEQLEFAPSRDLAPKPSINSTGHQDPLFATNRARLLEKMIQTEFQIKQDLDSNMNLELDLNLDSLQRIELIARSEELFSVRLTDDVSSQILTLGDLLHAVNIDFPDSHRAVSQSSESKSKHWQQTLADPGLDDCDRQYLGRSSKPAGWLSFIILRIVYLLAKLLFRLRVEGLENVPKQGPFLICPNHQSYLDGILLLSALRYRIVRDVFSVGKSPYFAGTRRLIARLAHIIPIDPDLNLVRAMKVSAAVLKRGGVLLIFPEGTRTFDGEVQHFKKGAAILATELRIPVLPVAINGSFEAWSKTSKRVRLAPIKISFGRLIHLDEAPARGDDDLHYADAAGRIHDEVSRLLSQSRRFSQIH